MRDEHNLERVRHRISQNQRRATELSIELTLEALDQDNVVILEDTAHVMESAVDALERARLALSTA